MPSTRVNIFVLNDMKTEESRPRGRPRKFDRDEVLERALNTFWDKGYASTSLDDLTDAMGINRPSLYASFGSKQDLFMETMDRYGETIGQRTTDALLEEPDIEKAVAAFFDATLRCVQSKDHPNGCLIMNVAVERSVNDPLVRKKIEKGYAEKLEAFSSALPDGVG